MSWMHECFPQSTTPALITCLDFMLARASFQNKGNFFLYFSLIPLFLPLFPYFFPYRPKISLISLSLIPLFAQGRACFARDFLAVYASGDATISNHYHPIRNQDKTLDPGVGAGFTLPIKDVMKWLVTS